MRNKGSYCYLLGHLMSTPGLGKWPDLTDEQVDELSEMIKKASKTSGDEIALRDHYGLDCERVFSRQSAKKLGISGCRVDQLRHRTERSLKKALVQQKDFIIQFSIQGELIRKLDLDNSILREEIHRLQGCPHLLLDDLSLSTKAYYAMKNLGIRTVKELSLLTREDILSRKGMGKTTVDELGNVLKKHNLQFADDSKEKSQLERPIVFNRHAPSIGELLKHIPVDFLDLSVRASNCLEEGGIENIAQLINKKADDLFTIRNFGKTTLTEIKKKLAIYGLGLRG